MKIRFLVITGILCLLVVFTASCMSEFTGFKRNYVGTNTSHEITGTYELLDGRQTKDIGVKTGETIIFSYESVVEKGSLTIDIKDPDGKTVTEFNPGSSGTETVTSDKGGNYKLIITGDDTKGSFSISWEIKARS